MNMHGKTRSKYKPEYVDLFIEHLKRNGSMRSFAFHIGVSYLTVQNWVKKHPAFGDVQRQKKEIKKGAFRANSSNDEKLKAIHAEGFWESAGWQSLNRRLVAICHKRGKGSIADDVVSSYRIKLLEGSNLSQTLDQFFIDYCRKEKIHNTRSNISQGTYTEFNEDYIGGQEEKEKSEFKKIISEESPMDQAILNLFFKHGYVQGEIADLFGWTESYISQRIKECKRRIKIAVEREDAPKVKCHQHTCSKWSEGNCSRITINIDRNGKCDDFYPGPNHFSNKEISNAKETT